MKKPHLGKFTVLFWFLYILSGCSTVLRQSSYDKMNNSTNLNKPSWFQEIVLSLFEISKEEKERKHAPKVSAHPDNLTTPLPFGQ